MLISEQMATMKDRAEFYSEKVGVKDKVISELEQVVEELTEQLETDKE